MDVLCASLEGSVVAYDKHALTDVSHFNVQITVNLRGKYCKLFLKFLLECLNSETELGILFRKTLIILKSLQDPSHPNVCRYFILDLFDPILA